MEILIVGLIIVALMVYASTKLKKYTAAQFEREEVETEEFSLVKPEGFLHVLNDVSKFAFYAYSKEFGKAEAEDVRQAEIFIEIFDGKTFAQVCDEIKSDAESVLYEEFSDEEKICLLETEKTIDEIEVSENYKIVGNGKVFQIKVAVLKNFKSDYEERIETIFDSFRVK
jgi:hypothetical protein